MEGHRRLWKVMEVHGWSFPDTRREKLLVELGFGLGLNNNNDVMVMMIVQFNLFGGTVLKLGTDRHHYLLTGDDEDDNDDNDD